ncbi:hypothetical protein AAC387_Pa12g1518 [Persea americana]
MSSEFSDVKSRLSQILKSKHSCWVGVMEREGRRAYLVDDERRDHRPLTRANSRKSFPSSYFSVESILVLLCLTVSLLLLPLILPPLPPPPLLLLLLPIGILFVLLILAFIPSDVRNITTSYAS